MAKEETFYIDFTPDPKVLIALTHTPMKPLDALCELIDNSIDSFKNAVLQGIVINSPSIWIDLPKKRDIDNNIGILRIRDNGTGMTPEQAENAIKAGYSGNNSFDTLGLFGMGFNISTGKLGIKTNFMTTRKGDDFTTQVVIDLQKINELKSYKLEALRKEKTANFVSGTIIEISNWWPVGQANNGFIKKLVAYGSPKIREEIGRRYSTILRDEKEKINIIIDGEPVEPFEHCVWGSNRFVERKGNQIPARFDIDKVLGAKRRCSSCRTIIEDGETICPSCGSNQIRTVEERIKGWVGIQRFDDNVNYGIDLIRNGRAIRISEKQAFFEFEDDLKKVIKDYPIDSTAGRIVGEIHLDFVPVDFLKQDFQRSSDEWQRAISYLRGNSSLQPTQPGADKNDSVIFKLYQGYRKVRTPGTVDMYMGYWDEIEGKPKRFPNRDLEKEYYQKFLNKEEGYYDDAKWWEVVEAASRKPVEELVDCPECGAQNLKEAEVCCACGAVLNGKECINPDCKKLIQNSATTCPYCGMDQFPKVTEPWICNICNTRNSPDTIKCTCCGNEKNTINKLSEDELIKNSIKNEDLCINDLSVTLPDNSKSTSFSLEVYFSPNQLISQINKKRFPFIIYKKPDLIRAFIDNTHPLFTVFGNTVEEVITSELSSYIYDLNRQYATNYLEFNLTEIKYQIFEKYWADKVSLSLDIIKDQCDVLLKNIKESLAGLFDTKDSELLFNELSEEQQKALMENYFRENKKLPTDSFANDGTYLKYIPNNFITTVFEQYPENFFNGKIFSNPYQVKDDGKISKTAMQAIYAHTIDTFKNTLQTIIIFIDKPTNDILELKRIRSALNYLENSLEGE